jgi:7-cyano-7-deazaguanine synthase
MDSTTAFYKAFEETDLVMALSFNYGQRHKRELTYARMTAEAHDVPYYIVDIRSIGMLLKGSALSDPDVEVPHGHYAADNMAITIVPNRNMIMLSQAVGAAIGAEANEVWAAMHAGDHPIYPDCRPEFITAMNETIEIATESNVQIVAPFIDIEKDQIARIGHELNVDWLQTWSCYEGANTHCGRCGTCVERAEAFYLAAIPDPTLYQDPDFWKEATGVS